MCYWWFLMIGLGIAFLISLWLFIVALNQYWDIVVIFSGTLAMICGIAFAIILVLNIVCSISAKTEYYRYQEKYEYVMQVIDNRKEFENLGITQTILDYNSWLEKAKTSKQVFGKWSWYQFYDVESMKYLGAE